MPLPDLKSWCKPPPMTEGGHRLSKQIFEKIKEKCPSVVFSEVDKDGCRMSACCNHAYFYLCKQIFLPPATIDHAALLDEVKSIKKQLATRIFASPEYHASDTAVSSRYSNMPKSDQTTDA